MTTSILRAAINKAALWSRINSPWLVHFNSGSCNGCDIEILATLAPRYDLERFGVKLQGSPRHADVLICTGPVTRLARPVPSRCRAMRPSWQPRSSTVEPAGTALPIAARRAG